MLTINIRQFYAPTDTLYLEVKDIYKILGIFMAINTKQFYKIITLNLILTKNMKTWNAIKCKKIQIFFFGFYVCFYTFLHYF